MKKIFVSLLMAMPLVASAQTSFTVESNGKKYAFPLRVPQLQLLMIK